MIGLESCPETVLPGMAGPVLRLVQRPVKAKEAVSAKTRRERGEPVLLLKPGLDLETGDHVVVGEYEGGSEN